MAAIAKSMDHPGTQAYLSELEKMHKVVLQAENEQQLQQLVSRLVSDNIPHHGWIEQPEGILSSVATAPADKSVLQPYFKQFKLFK